MKLLAALGLLVVLGCKSDAERAEQLHADEAMARLRVDRYQRKLDSVVAVEGIRGPHALTFYDSLSKAQAALAVTQRDLNKFMNGR